MYMYLSKSIKNLQEYLDFKRKDDNFITQTDCCKHITYKMDGAFLQEKRNSYVS